MATDPVSERHDYGSGELTRPDLLEDPVALLEKWLGHAATTDQGVEPTAMVLSTVDHDQRPASRTVLLRRIRSGRLYFFTSYQSRKGRHLDDNPNVSLLFRWTDPIRQVEVQGTAVRAPATDSDEYFATRPRESQIGAHASPQSAPIADRQALDDRVAQVTRVFEGQPVPRPDDWGGYVVSPRRIEFWQGRSGRLHDRFAYTLVNGEWRISRLAP